ncbi:hypothetical protein MN116_002760 [Schistosoma mekongi]|uniref:Receptor expression-enhancing protein n=1 Tax=Schistosoma mekongi TaxID=38744 RepID=A0AAE1ZH92_SCHME|nr:hypothetical protein MN116_002760 [Schistosoma mekongi]
MEKFAGTRKALEDSLRQKNWFTDLLEKAEKKSGIDRLYIVAGSILVIFLYLIFGYGTSFLANLIGFIYPAYRSIKALETVDKGDDTKWLTYWVVFATLSVIESLTDIFFYWIPLYSLLKCFFFLFMMIPTSPNGAVLIYEKVIRPHFLAHERNIDKFVSEATDLAGDFGNAARKKATDVISQDLVGKRD